MVMVCRRQGLVVRSVCWKFVKEVNIGPTFGIRREYLEYLEYFGRTRREEVLELGDGSVRWLIGGELIYGATNSCLSFVYRKMVQRGP